MKLTRKTVRLGQDQRFTKIATLVATALAAAIPTSAQFTNVSSSPGPNNNGSTSNGLAAINSTQCVSLWGKHVAFVSAATDFPGGADGQYHVYVRDRSPLQGPQGQTMMVSHRSGQNTGNSGWGFFGQTERGISMSADGRYVAYVSTIPSVNMSKTSQWADIFLVDRDTDGNGLYEPQFWSTQKISIAYDGSEPNGNSSAPSVSNNGNFVAFASKATNLVQGDTNGFADIFVWSAQTGTISRVNNGPANAQANGPSRDPIIANSWPWQNTVVFTSDATNLVAATDVLGHSDVFMYRHNTAPLIRLSQAPDGSEANGPTRVSQITGYWGEYVVFDSVASNLLGTADNNNASDVFLLDRDADNDAVLDEFTEQGAVTLTRVSVNVNGNDANGFSTGGSVDLFGRFVAFKSTATDLVGSDLDGSLTNVFLRDLQSGTTTLEGLLPNGTQAVMGPGINDVSISPEGGTIAFGSYNPSPQQVYLRDTETLDWDGDGLLDSWEIVGIDVNKDFITDVFLQYANPAGQDLYLEVDGMAGRVPLTGVFQTIQQVFSNSADDMRAPITLHYVFNDLTVPLQTWTPNGNQFPPEYTQFKNQYFGSATERASANWPNIRQAKLMSQRYLVFADTIGTTGIGGMYEIPGNDGFVSLGNWAVPGGTQSEQAGVFLHEFGHGLGLDHGGGDPINYKPNYHSIMNYTWTVPSTGFAQSWRLDFSRSVASTLNESCLNEAVGLTAGTGHASHWVPVGPAPARLVLANGGSEDWNQNGWLGDNCASADLTRIMTALPSSPGQVLTGYNDWANIWFGLLGSHSNFYSGTQGGTLPQDEDKLTASMFDDLAQIGNWSETFASYDPGTPLDLVGGWETWCDGGEPAYVSDAVFQSAPNSLAITYDGVSEYGSDVVMRHSTSGSLGLASGQVVFSGWTFVPSQATGSGYIIMLNQYCYPRHNWSMQVQFDADTGFVRNFRGDQLPLARDRWVEFRAEIDLDADRLTQYYDGQILATDLVWSENVSGQFGDPGIPALAATNLFSLNITEMYFDDLLLEQFDEPECPADFNNDGRVDTLDFLSFLNAFNAGEPEADFNNDGRIDTLDFLAFLNAFNAGC